MNSVRMTGEIDDTKSINKALIHAEPSPPNTFRHQEGQLDPPAQLRDNENDRAKGHPEMSKGIPAERFSQPSRGFGSLEAVGSQPP